ncbi:unnamed protein product, partial [Symbiodinium necroappetens]
PLPVYITASVALQPKGWYLTVHCPARQLPGPKKEGALALPAKQRKDACTAHFAECRATVEAVRALLGIHYKDYKSTARWLSVRRDLAAWKSGQDFMTPCRH